MRPLFVFTLSAAFTTLALAQPRERPEGKLEEVARFDGDMPTGVTVSAKGRIFLTFPRWGDDVKANVAELKDGKPVPYPNEQWNRLDANRPADCLLTVQSAVVGPADRLWLCDTGTIAMGPTIPGGPKLIAIDLATDKVLKVIPIPRDVALPTTYLNDLRFDLTRGQAGTAFVTDSSDKGPNGFVVVDLASGESWRKLNNHPSTRAEPNFQPIVEGRPLLLRPPDGPPRHWTVGADGLALSHDGKRLFYRPLCGRRLYSVSADALADRGRPDEEVAATVEDHGDTGFASDGLEHDDKGRLYLTDYEGNAIRVRQASGGYTTLVHDPHALWPDTLSISGDGYLYFTANQLHRQPQFHGGKDLREKPYMLYRVKIDGGPVRLKR
jgi:sugar lactone lactonase YvrE